MKSDSPPSPLAPVLVELARAHASGEASPRVHLASRARVLGQLTTSRQRPRWLSIGPVLAGAAAVLVVMLGVHFGMRRSSLPQDNASESVSVTAVAPPSAVVAISAPNDQVIASLRPAFKKCYHEGLAVDPSMQGRIVIAATIGPDGVVQSAGVLERDGLSVEVGACLAAVVQSAKFEATGGRSTMHIPVAFVRK